MAKKQSSEELKLLRKQIRQAKKELDILEFAHDHAETEFLNKESEVEELQRKIDELKKIETL
jgi:endonuclease IV